MRGLLAGEEEIVAVVQEPLNHALAGEEVVAPIRRAERLQARAVLDEPAFDRIALAVLLLGAVLFDDDPRIKSGSSPGTGASGTTLECPGATTVAANRQ